MRNPPPEPPFAWMKGKPNTYRYHLENDTGEFLEYTRRKRLNLGASMLKLRRIYLDTKYWIYLRDVHLGRAQKSVHAEILAELRRLKVTGSSVCPVSYSIFEELMTQSDLRTRSATANLIAELSDDCTIQPIFEVFKAELFHFVTKSTKPNSHLYDVSQLVWTKASFVLGDHFLSLNGTGIPDRQALAMRKSMDDFFWEIRFTELIEALPFDDGLNRLRASNLADRLTSGKNQHYKECDTFENLFLVELSGVLDALSDISGELMEHLAAREGISGIPSNQILESGKLLGGLIRAAFEHRRLTTEFPTLSVPASLHASVRLDRKRKFKKGDSADFAHAALAVGYFDVFLTDSSLKHLLNSKNIDAEKNYGCIVLSDEEEVLNYLSSIN